MAIISRKIYEIYNGKIIRRMPETKIKLKNRNDKRGLVKAKSGKYYYSVVRLDNWYSSNRVLWAVDNGVI